MNNYNRKTSVNRRSKSKIHSARLPEKSISVNQVKTPTKDMLTEILQSDEGMMLSEAQAPKLSKDSWRSRDTKLYILLPVLLPLIIFVITGLRGIDFGYHWDDGYHLGEIDSSIRNYILIPDGHYDYPSMCYWLEFIGIIPTIIHSIQLAGTDVALVQQRVLEGIQSQTYLLRMRSIFLIVSSVSILWVYILVFLWRKNWIEALIASCVLGGSWEFAYHARWIAPDAILTQFGILTMLFIFLAYSRPKHRLYLRCAAAGAGLVFATKYPGGLFIIPVLVTAYSIWKHKDTNKPFFFLAFEVCCIFALVYLIVTPGTILQPNKFYDGLNINFVVYSESGAGATINPGPAHMAQMLIYLSMVAFSHYSYIAACFFGFSIIGIYSIYKENTQLLIIFLCFPILYLLYFSMQHVMVIRNIIIIIPFLSILAARGVMFVWRNIPITTGRLVFASVLLSCWFLNEYWLFLSSQTIIDRNSKEYIADVAHYIDDRTQYTFVVSQRVHKDLLALDKKERSNITTIVSPSSGVMVFHASEGFALTTPANDLALTTTWFGAWEINYNYYPAWQSGNDPIIVMPITKAIDAHINIFEKK